MIKFILVVSALTANGPVYNAVAEFRNYNQCAAVAKQIVPQLKEELGTSQVVARCVARTDV